jgi:tripartite-type tricarboxylate transporter receptor subunit TctC
MNLVARIATLLVVTFFVSATCAETGMVGVPSGYPAKAVRIIVPYPPGGMDVIARLIADRLSESLGTSIHVENLPGASGTIGTGAAANAPADGSTMLVINQDFVIQSSIRTKIPYHPLNSFTPVTLIATAPEMILVHPPLPAQNMRELLALLKASPGKYSYATPGYGTSPHLAVERLFRLSYSLDAVHVPFQGAGPAITSTIAGHTQILHITMPLVAQHIKGGTLRALAVASADRSPAFPDVPTLEEAGVPDHEVGFWMGIVVPAGTPSEVIDTLQRHTASVVALPVVKGRLTTLGMSPVASNSEEFAAHIKVELAKWSRVVRDAGLKID